MHAAVPHPQGLFSGRQAAHLGAAWASLHRDDVRLYHLRLLAVLVTLALGSAGSAWLLMQAYAHGSQPAHPVLAKPAPGPAAVRQAELRAALACAPAPVHRTDALAAAPTRLQLPSCPPLAMSPAVALPSIIPTPVSPLQATLAAAAVAPAALAPAPTTVTIIAKVTGYCPCTICCGANAEGRTSINRDVYRHPRGIAVDPRLLSYRSYLDVPGYGVAMVDDTGAAMRADGDLGVVHLDVRFKTHEEALRWGVRWLAIDVPIASAAARVPAADAVPAQE